MRPSEVFLQKKLDERRSAGIYRTLKPENDLVDFCSNDYLGFARSAKLKNKIEEEIEKNHPLSHGATGSRLISGNLAYTEETEQYIARLHNCEAGLLFNSGYDANLGLFSAVAQRGDTIITDALAHASIIDGARVSFATRYSFVHNDPNSLEEKLKAARGNCFVAIESVYSMDGNTAPIEQMLEISEKYNAHLIVDEAHAIGRYGFGLVNKDLRDRVFAKIVTFGKALGCHGAIVLGSKQLREYLINFARSFIYTTAAPLHNIAAIKMAYKLFLESENEINLLKHNISFFKEKIKTHSIHLIESDSTIQCVILGSNDSAKRVAQLLQNSGLDVRAILSPTVPVSSERVRICLHSFNTENEISLLTDILNTLTYVPL